MKKRFLQRENTRIYHVWLRSFMVCLCLALAGVSAWGQDAENWINEANTEWYNESEIEFTITTAEELAGLAQLMNEGISFEGKIITLDDNIDLSGKEWTPIGTVENPFKGTFEGKNCTIKNLSIQFTDKLEFMSPIYLGLFSVIQDGCIENLNVEGKISAVPTFNDNDVLLGGVIGSIIGLNKKGTISNCVSSVDCRGENFISIGGVVGENQAGKISKCKNCGDIDIYLSKLNQSFVSVGGICAVNNAFPGTTTGVGLIEQCCNEGKITIGGTNDTGMGSVYVGGLVGNNEYSSPAKIIQNCYNKGNIVNNLESLNLAITIGGIVGAQQFSSMFGTKGPYSTVKYCYNYGNISSQGTSTVGYICGDNCFEEWSTNTLNKVIFSYYWSNGNNIQAIGAGGNNIDEEQNEIGPEEKDKKAFINGEVAWLLRNAGFGQNLNVTQSDEYPTLRCFDETLPAVYQLTLHEDASTTEIVYRNSANLNLPDVGDNFGWFDSEGKEYFDDSEITNDLVLTAFDKSKLFTIKTDVHNGTIHITPSQEKYPENAKIEFILQENDGFQYEEGSLKCINEQDNTEIKITNNNGTYSFTMPAADVTISAMFAPIPPTEYSISIDPNIQNGTVTSDNAKAVAGKTITLTVIPADGYELSELYYMVGTEKNPITGTTFTMPAANVTVYATFTEKEDPTDPEEPVDPPVVDPTNYYNIYNETTYDFIDVSFSRNVVREGGSVNVYLGIPEGLDPAAVTLMFKRSLYGGWENLNTDDDGNYLINNIWTDIYVKAVVDESYIDPNPDENHIYIDLSETNDSIWLYTDHKLVEEGKTAVIQAEVAKSCQNKEIRYMYKRTVLGEWKEMPKDYSINQYVVRDITTDIYVKAYFVFDKQDPTTAKNPHHVYADITATCEGLYLDATRHKVADEGDTKVFLYVKKGFETKDARYQFKRGLKGEWEDLVPGIEQNTFQVTDIEGDIYLKGIDAVYTGTEDIDGMVRVYTKDGSLFVYTAQPEEISVVSMTGVTVKRTRQTGLQSYPLSQGIYVVCVGEQVFKVRVK